MLSLERVEPLVAEQIVCACHLRNAIGPNDASARAPVSFVMLSHCNAPVTFTPENATEAEVLTD